MAKLCLPIDIYTIFITAIANDVKLVMHINLSLSKINVYRFVADRQLVPKYVNLKGLLPVY